MKKILAYFKSENDAEKAAAGLRTLNTEAVYVERIPEKNDGMMFVPVRAQGRPDVSVGAIPDPENHPLKRGLKGLADGQKEPGMNYVLEFSVAENQLNEALEKLAEADAYLDEDMEM
ncbi:hypothetical protein [Salisediminibacterium beveridgei]|uniref:Uncharacterized protein n=1 Tax=Salisediminibacterium beveridgei TaxID=632773 RepID=A0A1D7QXQ7_9BACI|nr:hypothetical protein [Salisediminibacterium beveridgei]AOM83784.1 hypothetical protein BBEV_2444 [Salisediminibacterium beveridgei]